MGLPIGGNLATMGGFPQVMARLNAEIKLIKGRTYGGLLQAAILVRSKTEESSPKTPVDRGNLRASWFAVTAKATAADSANSGGFKQNKETGVSGSRMRKDHTALKNEAKGMCGGIEPVVITGFSAFYAAPVHEMFKADFTGKNARGKSKKRIRRPGAGPYYFKTHFERNSKQIVQVIADNVRIKG